MAKSREKQRALALRAKGFSIAEIAQQLRVSKSTVSVWCRDIRLSTSAMHRIAQRGKSKSTLGLLRYSEAKRQQRLESTTLSMDKGKRTLGSLSRRDIYCIGLGLYWGEGYKKGSQEFGFTNSDPAMITFYIAWLRSVFRIEANRLILRVSINATHRLRIHEVEAYWSGLTGVPLSQFTKPSLIAMRTRKTYENHHNHMGTLRVKVRQGTALRREVIGAIKSIEL